MDQANVVASRSNAGVKHNGSNSKADRIDDDASVLEHPELQQALQVLRDERAKLATAEAQHQKIYAGFAQAKAVIDEAEARAARIAELREQRAIASAKRYAGGDSTKQTAAIDAELKQLARAQEEQAAELDSAERSFRLIEPRLAETNNLLQAQSRRTAEQRYRVLRAVSDALMGHAVDRFETAYERYLEACVAAHELHQATLALGGTDAMGFPTIASGFPGGLPRRGSLPFTITTFWASDRFPNGKHDLVPSPERIDAAEVRVDQLLDELDV